MTTKRVSCYAAYVTSFSSRETWTDYGMTVVSKLAAPLLSFILLPDAIWQYHHSTYHCHTSVHAASLEICTSENTVTFLFHPTGHRCLFDSVTVVFALLLQVSFLEGMSGVLAAQACLAHMRGQQDKMQEKVKVRVIMHKPPLVCMPAAATTGSGSSSAG